MADRLREQSAAGEGFQERAIGAMIGTKISQTQLGYKSHTLGF